MRVLLLIPSTTGRFCGPDRAVDPAVELAAFFHDGLHRNAEHVGQIGHQDFHRRGHARPQPVRIAVDADDRRVFLDVAGKPIGRLGLIGDVGDHALIFAVLNAIRARMPRLRLSTFDSCTVHLTCICDRSGSLMIVCRSIMIAPSSTLDMRLLPPRRCC